MAIVDTIVTAQRAIYSGVVDVLGLSSRPLVLINHLFPEAFPSLSVFRDSGIFLGTITTGSVVLTGVSVAALFQRGSGGPFKLAACCYALEALFQLPRIALPFSDVAGYPGTHTGLVTLLLQIPAAHALLADIRPQLINSERYRILSVGSSLRYMSATLAASGGFGSRLLYGLSLPCFFFAFTPKAAWRAVGRGAEKCGKLIVVVASAVSAAVYGVLHRVLPVVRDFVVKVMQHRSTVGFYNRVVSPLWVPSHRGCYRWQPVLLLRP